MATEKNKKPEKSAAATDSNTPNDKDQKEHTKKDNQKKIKNITTGTLIGFLAGAAIAAIGIATGGFGGIIAALILGGATAIGGGAGFALGNIEKTKEKPEIKNLDIIDNANRELKLSEKQKTKQKKLDIELIGRPLKEKNTETKSIDVSKEQKIEALKHSRKNNISQQR